MKPLLFAFLILALGACADNKDKGTESGPASAPTTPGLNNVDGNLPDTSTTIRLNQPTPTDSSTVTDSLRR